MIALCAQDKVFLVKRKREPLTGCRLSSVGDMVRVHLDKLIRKGMLKRDAAVTFPEINQHFLDLFSM